jgi:hypothetical protein
MKLRLAALLLSAAAFAVHAEDTPDSQWRASPMTLATLLQDGYRIVTVLDGARGNAGSIETFYLQRDQSAFRCFQQRQSDLKTRTPDAPFGCFELVQPFAASGAK